MERIRKKKGKRMTEDHREKEKRGERKGQREKVGGRWRAQF